MKNILMAFLVLNLPFIIYSQSTYSKFYTPDSLLISCNGTNILSYTDTTFIVANTFYDRNEDVHLNGLQIICFNNEAAIVWQKDYPIDLGGFFISGFGDFFRLQDGGFAFFSFKYVSESWKENALMMRFDNLGNLMFEENYGKLTSQERILGAYQTSDGYLLSAGFTSNGYNTADIYILKINEETSDTIWTKGFEEENFQRSQIIREDYDGGYILGGMTGVSQVEESDGFNEVDGLIIKLNTDGTERWRLNLGTEDDDCHAYILPYPQETGKYIVWSCNGISFSDPLYYWNEAEQYYITKMDSTGTADWRVTFEDTKKEIEKVVILNNGELLVVGGYSRCGDDSSDCRSFWGWLAYINASGEVLWDRTYNYYEADDPFETSYNWLSDAIPAPDGGFIAVGRYQHKATETALSTSRVWLLKVDANGCLEPGCEEENIFVSTNDFIPLSSASSQVLMHIYPNPVQNKIQVQLNNITNYQNTQLYIYDVYGKLLLQNPLQQASSTINVAHFNNGIYLCQLIIDGQTVEQQKLIVIK